jgi:hypothetical protein
MLVTLAGHDIFVGRALLTQSTPSDYAHLIIACLMHDIGYVRGILKGDGIDGYVIDSDGRKVVLPRGSSDAALMPYHVDRSKLFVLDRMHELDAQRIARSIELTRFPVAAIDPPNDPDEEGLLVRAADLIGQLGDPHYLRKANALFCEFEEIGMNKKLGYESPADIIDKYPQFYWNMVSPHIQLAIRYLNVTARGRQWIANLYSNVFRAEREVRLSGPQASVPNSRVSTRGVSSNTRLISRSTNATAATGSASRLISTHTRSTSSASRVSASHLKSLIGASRNIRSSNSP